MQEITLKKIPHNTMNPFLLSSNLIRRITRGLTVVYVVLSSTAALAQLRTASVTGNWSNPATWGGQSVPTAINDVVINNGVIVTVDIPNAECANLTVNGGAITSAVRIGNNNLAVGNAIIINAPVAAVDKYLEVNNGSLSGVSLTIAATTNDNYDSYVSITGTGSINISENITMNSSNLRTYIHFSGDGFLNIGGNFVGTGGITSNINGGATAPTTGTVNFNGTGAQTIPAFNGYFNLTVSNSGTKSLAANTTVNRNLTIQGLAKLYCGQFTITGNAVGILSMEEGTELIIGNPAVATANTFPTNYTTANIQLHTNSTVTYQANSNQTISGVPYYGNLQILQGNTTGRVRTLGGETVVNGNLTIAGTSGSSVTLQVANNNITINGATNINAYGTLSDDNTTGNNIFVGKVTIASNGTFTNSNNPPFEFRGGIENNGIFNKVGSGTVSFTTNAQSISGTNNLIFNAGDIVISNPASVTVTTNMNLNGTNFINNSNATTAFNQTYGTFFFGLNGAQNINGGTGTGTVTFYNLALSGSNIKTAVRSFSVANDLTINAGVTLNLGTNSSSFTIGGNATISGSLVYGSSQAQTFTINGNLSCTGTLNMSGGSLAHVLNLGGTNNAITTFTTPIGPGSIINYFGNGDQQIFANSGYQNLIISGSGIKTIQGMVRVINTLDLRSASISLASYNLVLAPGSSVVSSLTGTFGNSNMIITEGTGAVERQAAAGNPSQFVMTYPLGAGGNYAPVQITSLSATVSGGAYLRVRTVPTRAANTNPSDLNRYWEITLSGITGTVANMSFTYADPTDVLGDQTKYALQRSPQIPAVNWGTPASPSPDGANPMSTIGTTVLDGTWTARENRKTLYSYQTGNWNSTSTWTTDPSGTLWQGASIPGVGDRIVILNGRTVSVTNNSNTVYSLTVNEGGVLDLASTTGHNFGSISGKGLIRLSAASMPGGIYDNFVGSDGGTVEYYNSSDFTFTQNTYNNLIIRLSSSAIVATIASDFVVNGNLSIISGNLRVGNNTSSRTATIFGSVLLENTGAVSVNNANVAHNFYLHGDLTNNGGTFKLHNLASPSYNAISTTGYANLWCVSANKDQTISCNGPVEPYWIIIDKGTDQTYMVDIVATANYFKIFGHTYLNNNSALNLRNGTLRLGHNINIPHFIHGQTADYTSVPVNSGQFSIPESAHLWINGADVTTTQIGGTIYRADLIFVYGKLTVTAGSFYENTHRGLIMAEKGVIEVNGGTLSTSIIRPAWMGGVHRGAYKQSGGVVNIRRDVETARANGANFFASLTLVHPDNAFIMTGGTLNILNSTILGGNAAEFSLLFGMNPENVSATGGTINITVPNNRNARILTTGELWNLNIVGNSSTYRALISSYNGYPGQTPAVAIQPLVVKNDFQIYSPVQFDAAGQNISIGRNFNLQSGATYIPGTNTTIFNGQGIQSFTVNGSIQGNLNNLTLSHISDLTIYGNNITVNGSLTIGSGCTLRDNGRTITVFGNITNSGTHFRPVSGAGSIVLSGTNNQVLDGDGNGTFNNLTLNKTGGSTTATANFTITGELRLANTAARLNIGGNKLHFSESGDVYDNTTGTGKNFSNNRMILISGLSSAGGVSKVYTGTTPFLFPVGIQVGAAFYYTPGSVHYTSAPTSYGTVTIRPVNGRHPLATGDNNALTMYWKTTSTGFSGVPAGSVSHSYFYDAGGSNFFVVGTEANYIPGVLLNGTTWNYINNTALVVDGTNEIQYPNANEADGEFTAGLISAFGAIPVLYSSSTPGSWNDPASWSSIAVGGTGGAGVPTAGTVVIIGNENHNHTITVTANGAVAGSLIINAGSTLDLQTFTGHNFAGIPERGVVGNGTLRIASGTFPSGDFGVFIGPDGGTVEYYTTTASITIPNTSASGLPLTTYKNLKLTHSGALTITMPNQDLTVYENLIIAATGTPTASARLNTTASRTVTINGNLIVNSGVFEFRTPAQTLKVMGNVQINGGTFQVLNNAAVTHTLEIYGSLIANSTFDMSAGTGYVNVYFRGTNNAIISGSSSIIDFYRLYVDKGNNTIPILELTTPFTVNPVTGQLVYLQNGTLRVNNPSLTVTLTTATTNFLVPSSACLSVQQGTCRVAFNAGTGTGTAKLALSGKLEVLGGEMLIGNVNDNTANDVEYAAGGTPIIDVQDGILTVAGQIRRPTNITTGSLNYYQSGGIVNIYGNNALTTRSKLEILNSGSLFAFTGGTLNILRAGGGTSFGDLYIVPDSSLVTGGTIQIGTDVSTADQNFALFLSCPVYNLTIGTATRGQNARINVYNLLIKNDLTISSASVFNANGLDVTIYGNLINNNISTLTGINEGGYRSGTITQTTTFNGVNQSITGSGANLTNFANLIIAPTGTLTLNANTQLRINGNLSLNSGTFATQQNNVFLLGNLVINAIHTSHPSNGAIQFIGTLNQTISGNGLGILGNVLINNANDVTLKDDLTINGRLIFTNGRLYIDDYLLTLGLNSTISTSGGSFGSNRMIMSNGVLSDRGVRKMFNSGATLNYNLPLGVPGKYSLITYTVHQTSLPGSLTVRPVNRAHPALTDDITTNNITFYWSVDSTGFGSDLQITSVYRYLNLDQGDEVGYVVGLYRPKFYKWYNLGNASPYTVDVGTNTITISTANFFSGEITAGAPSNFSNVVPLYSRNNRPNNDWFAATSWTTNSDGSDCSSGGCSGGYYASYPYRNPAIILEGHTIELNSNGAYVPSVQVIGEMVCGTTVNHDLGRVFGTGKVTVTSIPSGMFVFPGGLFDEFFDTPNTTVELTGNNTATLPLKPGNIYKPYQNVIFSGTGRKDVTAENLRIKGNMTIQNGASLFNGTYNKDIYIEGNWIDNNTTATGGFIPGTGKVLFSGMVPQLLTITGGSTTEQFYTLVINNSAGVTINGGGKVMVNKDLYLTGGNITTNLTNLLIISNTSPTAIIGGSASSFVNGPLRKNINNGQSFVFPVGSGTRFGSFVLSNTSVSTSPQYWTVTYVNSNPHPTFPTAPENLNAPLTGVSDNEYWVVNRPAGGSARITLRWDANSYPFVTSNPNLRTRLRVVEYEAATAKWTLRGDIVSGTATSGTVATATDVTADDYIFTLGIIGVTASIITPPLAYEICDNGEQASIQVALSGNAPWTLSYKTVGNSITQNFTQTGITSSPYTIQLTSADMGGYGVNPYVLSLVSVSDATSNGVVSTTTVSITVKQTYTPSITGPAAVGLNETRNYSTPVHIGSTYLWSWVGTSGGIIETPTDASTNIIFNASTGTFQLRVEETSVSGCWASSIISITVGITPQPDITPKTPNVCQGTTITYSTPYVAGNEYRWTVVNGTCTGCGNFTPNATIAVTWNSTGNASITVEERIIAQPTIIGTTSQNYYVSPSISSSTISGNTICVGDFGTITVNPTQNDVSYQLKSTDDSNLGTPQSGGTTLYFNTGMLTSTTNFYVLAYNEGCQLRIPNTGYVPVTVETPDINLVSSDSDDIICQGTEVIFTAQNMSTPAIQFNYLLNGVSVQNSTSSNYITSSLAHNDAVVVVGTTANGCHDTSNVIQVSVGNFIWSGAVSSAWETVDNWACGVLPTQGIDAFVPSRSVRMPIISDNSEVKNITIENGATVNHTGGVFSIYGDLVNSGTFSSTATVRFAGNVAQTINGANNIAFTNLTIDKPSDTLFLNRNVSISGNLQLDQGIVRTNPTAMITINHGATSSQGNANSYVNGPIRKLGNTNFVFPLGDQGQWARLAIWDITNGSASTAFVASFTHEPSPYLTQVETELEGRKLHHVSEVEHWDLSNPTNDPGISTNITLYWEDKSRSNITLLSDLRVAHFDGTKWVSHGGVGVSTGPNSGYIAATIPLTSFSPISFGSENGDNPLPVELLRFQASVVESGVVLSWETASERKNSHFEVQHSVDGERFVSIGKVFSQAPNGESSQRLDYRFSDTNPKQGVNYYRLKQVDFDGKFAYSSLVSATVVGALNIFDLVKIYPNPTSVDVILDIPTTDKIISTVLYNSSGELLLEKEFNPNAPHLDLSSRPSGLYLLKLISSDGYRIYPLIKQ